MMSFPSSSAASEASSPSSMTFENEDSELQRAVTQSLNDRFGHQGSPDSQAEQDYDTGDIPARRNIEDCIRELQGTSRAAVSEFDRLDVLNGDTWVFIKPPSREPQQADAVYSAICARFNRPIRASHRVLLESESSIITKQLGSPSAQFRIIRRLGVTKAEMERAGIKYVLDLTPPVEGDEAVEITEQLSCPEAIMKWVRTSQHWRVSAQLVGGLDELTASPTRNDADLKNAEIAPDYTPLRHRFALERTLSALHDFDPTLDSAPKVYTTVMAATKHLGIPAHRLAGLTDYVVRWVRAMPNSFIIELHPEVILKIADCLQCEPLCKDAFAILVGEASLEMVTRFNEDVQPTEGETVHKRKRMPVEEIWETRIQYARDVFVDRVNSFVFEDLIHPDMNWVDSLLPIQSIPSFSSQEYNSNREALVRDVKAYIRGAIYHLLSSTYSSLQGPNPTFFESLSLDRHLWKDVFNGLKYQERVLTRSFWNIMDGLVLSPSRYESCNNLGAIPNFNYMINLSHKAQSGERELIRANVFNIVTELQIYSNVRKLYEFKKAASTPLFASQMGTRGSSRAGNADLHPHKKRRSVDRPPDADLLLPIRTHKPPHGAVEAQRTSTQQERSSDNGRESPPPPYEPVDVSSGPGAGESIESSGNHEPLASLLCSPRSTTNALRTGSESLHARWSFSHRPATEGDPADETQRRPKIESDKSAKKPAPVDQVALEDCFNFQQCLISAENYLQGMAFKMLSQPNQRSLELDTINTLLCLDERELKFLPLWAGGVDDGTSGVFGGEVLMADDNEFGPGGAGLRSGRSEFDYDGLSSIGDSTANTSRLVHDGHSVIADRRQVYAASEVESVDSVVHAPGSVVGLVSARGLASDAGTESTWEALSTPAESVDGASSENDHSGAIDMEETGDLFMDSGSDDSDAEDGVDIEDELEMEYDLIEAVDARRPGTATSEASRESSVPGDNGLSGRVRRWADQNKNLSESVIKYKEREQSPLTFGRD